jgi:hypothetical protein
MTSEEFWNIEKVDDPSYYQILDEWNDFKKLIKSYVHIAYSNYATTIKYEAIRHKTLVKKINLKIDERH